jgi:MYXO-CTERM domain-containing protein
LLVGGGWVYREISGPPVIPACTLPAGLCWSDDQANYETNEVAINWNAALVYALASFVGGGAQVPTGSGVGAAGNAGNAGNGAGGAPAAAGSGMGGAESNDHETHRAKSGCGCSVGDPRSRGLAWLGLLGLGVLAGRRRVRFPD